MWFALLLLVVSICINYIDRGNLSVAGPTLSKELAIDPEAMGRLYSAFFWTYALSQFFVGWFIDRYNVNWIYAAGYGLWSAATALTGYAQGFASLFGLRLILGVSESIAYPCYSKIIAGGFPEQQRGIANSLIDAGSKMGPALGILICGQLLASYGWRTMFILIGGVSLLWLLPWSLVAWRQKVEAPAIRSGIRQVSTGAIFSQRAAWGTFLGLFCYNYAWYFLITWLPSYLVSERHYTTQMMSTYGSLPFWGVAGSSLVCGFVSDLLIGAGASPTRVRKSFVVTGLLLGTLLLPAALVTDARVSMALLVIACVSMGLFSSNCWAITQTLATQQAAARWTGFQNAFANFAGVVAPWLTGWSVKTSGSYVTAFAVAAAMLVVGAASYAFLVRDVRPIRWHAEKN